MKYLLIETQLILGSYTIVLHIQVYILYYTSTKGVTYILTP
jgi:hypothetical protein